MKATKREAAVFIYEGICYDEAVRRMGREMVELSTAREIGEEILLGMELAESFWRPANVRGG